MREDIPHPDKRKSLRVVLGSSPVYSRGFSRNLKRDSLRSPSSLPGASRDGLGLTVVSLPCPKGCIFWCESWGRERTQTIHKAAGVDNGLRRLRWSSSKGVLRPLQPHSWCPHTREETGKKKIRRQRHKRLTYLSPRDILCMLKGDKVFRLTFGDYLPLFAPPRSTGLVFPVSAGFVNFPANVFSYNYFPLLPFSTICQKDNVTEGWHPPPSVI